MSNKEVKKLISKAHKGFEKNPETAFLAVVMGVNKTQTAIVGVTENLGQALFMSACNHECMERAIILAYDALDLKNSIEGHEKEEAKDA
jgi:hypothetical protein